MREALFEYEVKQITAEDLIALRSQVLRPHHPLMDSVFPGDAHPLAGHYGAVSKKAGVASVLAIGTIYPESSPSGRLEKRITAGQAPKEHEIWRLRGMATEESARGQGLGKRVLLACIEHVRNRGGLMIWANARTPALNFYRRAGFEVIGEQYTMPGIGPHYFICLIL